MALLFLLFAMHDYFRQDDPIEIQDTIVAISQPYSNAAGQTVVKIIPKHSHAATKCLGGGASKFEEFETASIDMIPKGFFGKYIDKKANFKFRTIKMKYPLAIIRLEKFKFSEQMRYDTFCQQ